MINIISKIFNFFGFTIVSTIDYDLLCYEKKHYENAYNDAIQRHDEFHDFVDNEIMGGYQNSIDLVNDFSKRYKELLKVNDDLINHSDDCRKLAKDCLNEKEQVINICDRLFNIIKTLDFDSDDVKNINFKFDTIQKTIKQEYRRQLSIMGIAIDRLMGEMMSANNYTENEFRTSLGYLNDEHGNNISVYDNIQMFMPPFNYKYSEN